MKIYFIGQKGIPAKSGGVEKHVEALTTNLAKQGQEVFVYTRPNYTDKKLTTYQGVRLISRPSLPTKHLDAFSHTLLCSLDVLFRRADVVHFQA
ncbi:MAG TPA: glycosyltransferase, partial [bacterium]|nr:glycosyltransferase [bacterium]